MRIEVDEDVFKVYAMSIALLVAKTIVMSLLTARQRFKWMVRILHSKCITNKDHFTQRAGNIFFCLPQ